MFNVIYRFKNEVFMQENGQTSAIEIDIYEYLDILCLLGGATFKGSIQASRKMLPNTKKVPIYIPEYDDYLIPLASPKNNDCVWISAREYLTCYEEDSKTFIKFKDRSTFEVNFSMHTIKMQYQKTVNLDEEIRKMKLKYGR